MISPFIMRNFYLLSGALCLGNALCLLLAWTPDSLAGDGASESMSQLTDTFSDVVNGGRAYTPHPTSRTSNGGHTTGGVRGCSTEMAAIAPRLTVGQTIASHPTFVWYVFQDVAASMEFQLYRSQSDGTLEEVLTAPVGNASQGYVAYTLPQEETALTVGDRYVWQVILYCDPGMQEVGQWTSADIEIVDPATRLASVPSATADALATAASLEAAQTYGQLGLWYDAMAAVYDAETPAAINFRQNLLLDLADLEAQADAATADYLSTQLRQIAAMP